MTLEQSGWLIDHSAVLWKVAVALGALLGCEVALLLRRRTVWRIGRIAALGPPVANLDGLADGTAVTIRGRIEAQPPLARSLADDRETAITTAELRVGLSRRYAGTLSARAAGVVLRSRDTAIELAGPLEVIAGSTEDRPRRLRLGHPAYGSIVDAVGELEPRARVAIRTVRGGDEVLVRGRLRLTSGVGAYRTQAARWQLEPIAELIPVASLSGARLPIARTAVAAATGGGWGAAFTLLALFVVGHLALAPYPGEQTLGRVAVATLSPFHRDSALDLATQIEDRGHVHPFRPERDPCAVKHCYGKPPYE